ncbi:MAG: hypothetical protein JST91_24110 [Actinobacteria bacterium]|nr:hypothetical protein [Actinomycetota bacterium]
MAKPNPIEVKVNIAGNVGSALSALKLGEGEAREVWFLDDLTDGLSPALPLLSAGIVLRLRRKGSGAKAKEDSTVKLRPCRRSQLVNPWDIAPASDDFRVEGDWSHTRRVLAASYVADLEPGTIADALDDGHLKSVFTAPQRAFLTSCGPIGVALSGISALGPIASRQWKGVTVGRVNGVDAERWTVSGLDFLELSIRVTTGAEDTAKQQKVLEEAVADCGLELDTNENAKTVRVMKRLAGMD